MDVGSDHCLTVANIKIKLKVRRMTKKSASAHDTNKLLNTDFHAKYIIELSNQFSVLQDTEDMQSI